MVNFLDFRFALPVFLHARILAFAEQSWFRFILCKKSACEQRNADQGNQIGFHYALPNCSGSGSSTKFQIDVKGYSNNPLGTDSICFRSVETGRASLDGQPRAAVPT